MAWLTTVVSAWRRERDQDAAEKNTRLFAGYLVLDAVIGNTDRHHENWGLLRWRVGDGWEGGLAPSFDHASSLGRELLDTRRSLLLEEDRIGWYSEKGRGGIHWSQDARYGPSPLELVRCAVEQPVAREPTGPFHRDLEDALLKAGLPLYSINPYQVRCFARSQGRRAKTDAVDARTLATMAEAIDDLRPTLAKSESQRDLAELKLVRDALIKDRTRTLNRGKHLRHALAKRVSKERLAQIERQLKRIDAEIAKLLRSEETLKRQSEILTSIPGISSVTAAGLIAHMPELGTMTGPQAASLAGLAPVTRESGTWKGRSFIQGGRDKVRRMLYMPALAAIRANPVHARKCAALLAAGKPPKVAITAVMRKLLVLANALVQQDRLWTPEPPATV